MATKIDTRLIGTALALLVSSTTPNLAAEPAGARDTKVTDWTDPRPADWATQYPLFAPATPGDGSLKQAQEKGITVCAQLNIKPIDFIDTETGKVIGLEPDIMAIAAEQLGIKSVDYVNINFGALIPALQADKCTIVMGGIATRSDRAAAAGIKYATPYFVWADTMIVLKDSGIKSEADLKGKVISVLAGSTEEVVGHQVVDRIGGATVRSYPAPADTFQALLSGNADGLVETPIALTQHPERAKMEALPGFLKFTPAGKFASEFDKNPYNWGAYAPITKASDGDLNLAISIVFSNMIKDGTMKTLMTKWDAYSDGMLDTVRK
ncbi:transporter substrate-binding domain-containing protein [Mesorhizobium sp. 2RAF21]|uniref:amino acid ABC transporter substrate-binding protein n=1 Tax=Mesorhizobium sp. 2RAF21 TaxID=3232995 RepID=UPI003F96FEF8